LESTFKIFTSVHHLMRTMRGTLRFKASLYKEWEEQYRGVTYTLSMAISARQF
jgi:hypothetical protein